MARIDYAKFAKNARTVSEYESMIERESSRTGEDIDISALVTAWSDKETKKMFTGGEEISVGESVGQIFGKGLKRTSLGGGRAEPDEIFDLFDLIFDYNTGKLKSANEIWKTALLGFGNSIKTQFTQEADLLEELNRRAGMTGDLSREFRREIFQAYPDVVRLGFSFDDLKESMSTLIQDAGRFKIVSSETISNIALVGRAFFDSMDEASTAIAPFQNVSRGASDAMDAIIKAGERSLELGLNSRETVKNLVDNVDKLNAFGFRNGIDGLTKMIQKAQSLRMDLRLAFDLADTVMDPSKALSLAANLQVIGGALGDFNDPIKLMWMATNNVEGLQDALAGTLESLTTFNSESGVFEIAGADLRRLRAIASELGMNYQELGNIAVQSAQRTVAAGELMTSGLIFSDEDDKEFLMNLAQMEKGRMVIEVPSDLRSKLNIDQEQTKIAISDLSQEQANAILRFREQFKEMSTEDITREQFTAVDNIRRDVAFLAAKARVEAGRGIGDILNVLPREIAETFSEFTTNIGSKTDQILQNGINRGSATNMINAIKITPESNLSTIPMTQMNITNAIKETEQNNIKKTEKTESSTTSTKNVNLNYNFTSDVPADVIRWASKNLQFLEQSSNHRSYVYVGDDFYK